MSHEVSAASLQGDCSKERTSAMEDNNNKAATQAVQVAVNIRPLIAQERIQGCKDCLKVTPHAPQVVCFLEFLYCRACLLV
jgi:acetate kinase